MFVIVRAIVYAFVFAAVVLVFLPASVLSWSGVTPPDAMGWQQFAGIAICALGVLVALSCVLAFAWIGKGTPAPFDPPQRLVVRGLYACVRNPMYLGGASALAGAALYYQSLDLLLFAVAFLAAAHLFVVLYEEPTLRRTFGEQYETYCRRVHRWLPRAAPAPHLRPHAGQAPGSTSRG